jgi:hypothetical protein
MFCYLLECDLSTACLPGIRPFVPRSYDARRQEHPRGLDYIVNCGVEVTELSTNKQLSQFIGGLLQVRT